MKLISTKLICAGLLIIFTLSSCSYVYQGRHVFRVNENAGGSVTVYNTEKYELDKCEKVTIEDKGSYLVFKFDDTTPELTLVNTVNIPDGQSVTAYSDFISKYTGSDMDLFDKTDKCNSGVSYLDIRPVFQGLTIPIKLRPALKSVAYPDSFPSQVETGFNAGFSIGCKISHNMFRSKKNFLGLNTTRLSITPGWFFGLGKVDLKKSNTRGPVIGFERPAAMVSTGGYIMAGFNNVSFGYSFGWDYATGTGRQGWVYKNQLWHGIIVAFDIIK